MDLTTIVGKVLRPLGLAAAVYGCGGGRSSFYYDGMCEDNARLCQLYPGVEGYDHCFSFCDESSNRYYNLELCATAYCEVEGNTCLGDNIEEKELTRGFIDCMKNLGYTPPSPN